MITKKLGGWAGPAETKELNCWVGPEEMTEIEIWAGPTEEGPELEPESPSNLMGCGGHWLKMNPNRKLAILTLMLKGMFT